MPIDSHQATPVVAILAAGYLAWSGTSPGKVGVGHKNEPLPEFGQPAVGAQMAPDRQLRDPFGGGAAGDGAPITEGSLSVVESLHIGGVIIRGNTRRAVIDGTEVAEGTTYRGIKVESIRLDRIVFRVGDEVVERAEDGLFPSPERARLILNTMRVDGVSEAGGTRRASVDGVMVCEGDKFNGVEIAQIEPDRVVFRVGGELVEKPLANGPDKTHEGKL